MNLGEMRDVLRGRLNEATAGNWSDVTLNSLLNVGASKTQAEIMRVDPLAFVNIWQQSINADQEFYDKPVGLQYEYMLRLKDSGTGHYFQITKGDYYQLQLRNLSLTTPPQNFNAIVPETKYAHLGRHFAINPIPSVTVIAGLQVIGVPTLSMAVDTDVLEINLALHMLPVLWAHVFAMGDTQEPLDKTLAVIDRLEGLIPQFYRQSAGDPVTLQPDIIKDYGFLDR